MKHHYLSDRASQRCRAWPCKDGCAKCGGTGWQVRLTPMRIEGAVHRIMDITGIRNGMLEAVVPWKRVASKVVWKCQCDCGGSRLVVGQDLLNGRVRYCHACRPRSPLKAMRDEREACALLAATAATGLEAAGLIRARCAP